LSDVLNMRMDTGSNTSHRKFNLDGHSAVVYSVVVLYFEMEEKTRINNKSIFTAVIKSICLFEFLSIFFMVAEII
jgi:hypothetical protein